MSGQGPYFDIHSMITLVAPGASGTMRTFLLKQFGLFLKKDAKSETADITLIKRSEIDVKTIPSGALKNPLGFAVLTMDNELSAVFSYRGEPDIIIVFTDTVKILYPDRPGVFGRLRGILLFCIHILLQRKEALLLHAAVVQKDGLSMILAGPHGSKKTMLLLTMLRNGWNYLADDKSILHKGLTYIVESDISLAPHHMICLPWLNDHIPAEHRCGTYIPLKQKLRTLAKQHLPGYLFSPLDRFMNPSLRVDVQSLFPSCTVLNDLNPSHVVLLSAGPSAPVKEVSENEIIADMATIQKLSFSTFTTIAQHLSLRDRVLEYSPDMIMGKNLSGKKFLRLTVPHDAVIDEVYKELVCHLDQQS